MIHSPDGPVPRACPGSRTGRRGQGSGGAADAEGNNHAYKFFIDSGTYKFPDRHKSVTLPELQIISPRDF